MLRYTFASVAVGLTLPLATAAWAQDVTAGQTPSEPAPDQLASPQTLDFAQTSADGTQLALDSTAASAAMGQDAPEAAQATSATSDAPVSDDKWHLATIGYGWLAGAYGTTKVGPRVPEVEVHETPTELISQLKWAFMSAAEVRKGRFIFLGDMIWVHLGASDEIQLRDRTISGSLKVKTFNLNALAGYRLVDKAIKFDLMAGAAYNGIKESVKLQGPVRSFNASLKESWIDPVIAGRVIAPITDSLSTTLYGDVGGVAFGSDISWQLLGTLNFRLNKKMQVGGGWRYFKVDYKNGGFRYNVALSGPIIAFRTDLF